MKNHMSITILEAAELMGTDPQFLRIALQKGRFPFVVAIKRKRWAYYINRERFFKYLNATEESIEESEKEPVGI